MPKPSSPSQHHLSSIFTCKLVIDIMEIIKKWRVMMCLVVAVVIFLQNAVAAEPQVPCLFIFGDSLIDNGNNNNKISIAKATFLPYGIDFPDGPTGRFSNGKTAVDVIGELLGFDDYIPSYASARGEQILRGVNYASAAAGIRPETGRQLGDRTDFSGQVDNFKNTVAQLTDILGGDQHSAANYLNKCIFLTGLGTNDFINNYYLPNLYTTSLQYSLQQYLTLLIQQYSHQLRVLYSYGARKLAVIGLAPSGCIPFALTLYSPDGSTCVGTINKSNQLFNKKLIALVDHFNTEFRDAKFIYINGYDISLDVINNPSANGFKVKNTACCGRLWNNATFLCLPLETPCEKRDEYVFWDFAHPTQAANIVYGRRSYRAEKPSDAYPFDISRLARL